MALDDLPSDEEDPGDENFCHQDEGEDIGSEKRGIMRTFFLNTATIQTMTVRMQRYT